MNPSTVKHRLTKAVLPFAALASLAACGTSSDATGTARQPVSLSFTTRSAASAAASISAPGSRADLVAGGNGELVLTKIQLVLNRIELTRSDAVSCVSDDSVSDDAARDDSEAEHAGCEEVSRNPVVLDVPVDAAVHTALNVPLSAGTYTKLEARIGPADQVAASNPELAGASIRVTGTFKGTAFAFTTPLRRKIEMEFNPPLVIDASTQNATVNIDVASWFKSASGAPIDPATANAGGINAARVQSNIRASFRAFEDDDRGGDDDHGHHSGRDH
jgi:hypothetical protein